MHTGAMSIIRNALFAAVLAAAAVVGGAAPAVAQASFVEDAAAALQSDPVYVHPSMEAALSPSDADRLGARINAANVGPVYIAVLPEEAVRETGGDAGLLLQRLAGEVRVVGTYAVVAGRELVAGADDDVFAPGVVPQIADETSQANQGGSVEELLFDFVGRLEEAASGEGSSGGGDSGLPGFGWVPVLLVGGGIAFVISRRRRVQRERAQLEEVKEAVVDDLVALGDDLRTLDLDVEMPGADPRAKEDYVTALSCYEEATAALDRAERPQDLQPVTAKIDDGRFAIASAKARLEGRPLPERRPPCFFDPRHGPSVRDVDWAPPGGAARTVPACESDARRVEAGEDPEGREVTVGGRRMPYWDAPPYWGPWAGGYYGFGGGLFEGMLLGSILSGGFGGFGGFGGDGGDGGDGGGLGDFGGGELGGGDFGGGDLGGGGFGGGEF